MMVGGWTSSGSCSMVGFGLSSVEPLDSATLKMEAAQTFEM
jgi:hypothetical protein